MESFVAWNGSSYAGPPPENWYLAQDNRWWPSEVPSAPAQHWQIREGSLEGYLTIREDGLHCVFEQGGVEDLRFVDFDLILRVSRTKNTFGSEGIRIQTTSQTFEWTIDMSQDDIVDLINEHLGRPEQTLPAN